MKRANVMDLETAFELGQVMLKWLQLPISGAHGALVASSDSPCAHEQGPGGRVAGGKQDKKNSISTIKTLNHQKNFVWMFGCIVGEKKAKKNETTWTDAKKTPTLTGLEPATLGRITRSALKIERELISSQSR